MISYDRLNILMTEIQSDKKILHNSITRCNSINCIDKFLIDFKSLVQVANHNRVDLASQYIRGLLKFEKGKANMPVSLWLGKDG